MAISVVLEEGTTGRIDFVGSVDPLSAAFAPQGGGL